MRTQVKTGLDSYSVTPFCHLERATSIHGRCRKTAVHFRNITAVGVLLGLMLGTAQPALAQFDPSLQFLPVTNPNGVWSYGLETVPLGSPFNLFTLPASVPASPGPGIDAWLSAPLGTFMGVFHNGTPLVQTVTTGASEISQFNQGMLAMNAGPNDEYALVQFTAPANGIYTIQGTFEGIDTAGTVSSVSLLANNVPLISGSVVGFGPGSDVPLSSGPILLGAGQTLAYAVGGLSNNSMTALINAQVSAAAVPEPSMTALLGLALVAFIVRARFTGKCKAVSV